MSAPFFQQDLNFKLTVTPSFDFDSQTLTFDTASATRSLHREVVCFKEAKVRECLIALGWTPPLAEKCRQRSSRGLASTLKDTAPPGRSPSPTGRA